jgi:rhamnose utilization protein RhaD (predicted bifunctional aldolase and dehydrogenase)/NAD(P)-dependent dehydrogenase (short-subunit alcohol dehydrogenase family)
MRSAWSDTDAASAVRTWGGKFGETVALRTYSSRLLGGDRALVLHGGGNTSVKAPLRDVFSDEVPALFVKGSGWDLATILPEGFSPVDLGWVRRLRALPSLTDEAMVETLRTHLLREAPDPSIETLLHGFLPDTFVDHSHADAIVGLTNRPDGAAHTREALGEGVVLVPYVKAGYDLAKVAAAAYDAQPDAEGMVLLHHGLFTWGPTAREAYERHVALVDRAERYLLARHRPLARTERPRPPVEQVLPALRGALSRLDPAGRRFVLRFRPAPSAHLSDLAGAVAQGPLTPDHVLRTKPRALALDLGPGVDRAALEPAVQAFADGYRAYFEACAAAAGGSYQALDPVPRVVWLAGLGVVGVGATAREADAAADIAVQTLATVEAAAGLGPLAPLPDERLFEMEYWSLEQRKLGKQVEPLLARRVALITGAGGAIGVGVARQLLASGAHVVLTDRDPEALARAAAELGERARCVAVTLDVTDTASVEAGFDAAVRAFGGVDLVVVNAGIAVTGALGDVTDADFARATEVNLHGAHRTIRAAAHRFEREGRGGDVVMISTKNVAAPGAGFGAYSATKAGAHQLARVAAVELAPLGVRVNLVAPDAVFSEGAVASGLWAGIGPDRARARGLEVVDLPAFYRGRNLLKLEVTGSHVGHAVVFLASGRIPTTGAVLPVDGGLPEAFPR